MKKYILTENTKEVGSITLHQIVAVKSFNFVKKGEVGGWIEKEENLSHEGNAFVYDDACVFGNAEVSGNACIFNNAKVYGNARIYSMATIYDSVEVYGNAWVYGSARVFNSARIYGNTHLGGNASIYDSVEVYGNAVVYDSAMVVGSSHICGNAKVGGGAIIWNNARIKRPRDVVWFSPVGSRNDTLTAYRTEGGGIEVTRGCFSGSIDEFEEAVKERYKNTAYGKEYLALIGAVRSRFLTKK